MTVATAAPWQLSWDTVAPPPAVSLLVKDGTPTLTWLVIDGVGSSHSLTRTVTVDNTKPTLKIASGPKTQGQGEGREDGHREGVGRRRGLPARMHRNRVHRKNR